MTLRSRDDSVSSAFTFPSQLSFQIEEIEFTGLIARTAIKKWEN